MISTERRIQYAQGYIQLGLFNDAAKELDAVSVADCAGPAVIGTRIELNLAAKRWAEVITYARLLLDQSPDEPHGWISMAYAMRRLVDLPSAETILLEAEKRIGSTCALVHYNLACYRCQLGDHEGATQRVATACRMDAAFKAIALEDPDLAPIRSSIAALS